MYYGCENCSFKSFSKEKVEKHIDECNMSPKNQSCAICEHLKGYCDKGLNATLEVVDDKCPEWVLNKKIPAQVLIRN